MTPGQAPQSDQSTVASVAFSMYDEYKEPLYAAPPLLQRMVDAGRLGRKSGSGFYTYA
jgi:3-hydroxybutyryl-CoA dehydrogenase